MEITKKQIEKQIKEDSGLIQKGRKYCSITNQVIEVKRMYVVASFFSDYNLSKLENIYIPVDISELFLEEMYYEDADGDFHECSFIDWLFKIDIHLAEKTLNNINEYINKKVVENYGNCVAISGDLLVEIIKATQVKRAGKE